LTLATRITRATTVRFDHAYELTREKTLVAEATSTIACVGRDGKVRQIPENLVVWACCRNAPPRCGQSKLLKWNPSGLREYDHRAGDAVGHGTHVRFDHAYELSRDKTLLAEAISTITCVGTDGKVRAIPEAFMADEEPIDGRVSFSSVRSVKRSLQTSIDAWKWRGNLVKIGGYQEERMANLSPRDQQIVNDIGMFKSQARIELYAEYSAKGLDFNKEVDENFEAVYLEIYNSTKSKTICKYGISGAEYERLYDVFSNGGLWTN
jgi:acyl-CoA thioesterase FadM